MSSLNRYVNIRENLLSELDNYIQEANIRSCYTGLVRLKIDNLHSINTGFGYRQGQNFLYDIFLKFQRLAQFDNCLFALAENEYAVILPYLKNPIIAELAVDKIKQSLTDCELENNNTFKLAYHIGTGIGLGQDLSPSNLCLLAESALDAASSTLEKLCFLNSWEQSKPPLILNIEQELGRAIEQGELALYFQPKIDLNNGNINSLEALLRWKRGDTFVPPDHFIPQAERSDIIFPMTKWVIHNALRTLSELPTLDNSMLTNISINISKPCFSSDWLEDELKNALGIWGVSGQRLTLEITETAFMEGLATIQKSCAGIRRNTTCQISIDDFGTGFSSFEFFKEVHAEELKIDKTFITNINGSSRLQNIVKCMVDLGKSADMKIVVEGIETVEELEQVLALDIDYAQGYYFAKPMPINELNNWMLAEKDIIRLMIRNFKDNLQQR